MTVVTTYNYTLQASSIIELYNYRLRYSELFLRFRTQIEDTIFEKS